jgi:hypothetical protein
MRDNLKKLSKIHRNYIFDIWSKLDSGPLTREATDLVLNVIMGK